MIIAKTHFFETLFRLLNPSKKFLGRLFGCAKPNGSRNVLFAIVITNYDFGQKKQTSGIQAARITH